MKYNDKKYIPDDYELSVEISEPDRQEETLKHEEFVAAIKKAISDKAISDRVLMSEDQFKDMTDWSKWESLPHENKAQEYLPSLHEEDLKYLDALNDAQIKYSMNTVVSPADVPWQTKVNPPVTWTVTSTSNSTSYWATTPQYVGQYTQHPVEPWPVAAPFFKDNAEQLAKDAEAEAMIAEEKEKIKRIRYPSYKKDDRVQTPEGPGSVWSVDRDGTVCVELDKDSNILYEFEKKEIKKIKTKG